MATIAMTDDHGAARPPSLFWTLVEGRSVFELGGFIATRPLLKRLPKGDGHPVLVLPGFLAGDTSTRPLRGLLKDLGYASFGWGMGRNLKFNADREAQMIALLDDAYENYGAPVSIVGWSLGGVFAREIAKSRPEKVRCIVTLGSPIKAPRRFSNARRLYDQLNGKPGEEELARMAQLNTPPPVPTTSIFTKTDGIVAWRGSVQETDPDNPQTENIEIPASHFGIGVNPFAMIVIADRLAQPAGEWAPFNREGYKSLIFRSPD
ncbi:MAG: alpha/beta hydrolase [Pseudomonadota bacterium]